MHNINVLDSVHCQADRGLIKAIAPCLAFKRKHTRQAQFGTNTVIQDAYAIDRRNGMFLTGLLPRVCRYLDTQKVEWGLVYVNNEDKGFEVMPARKPTLKSFELRAIQQALINKATAAGRGVVKAATGSGKTVMALGFISQYPYHRTLVLVHRLELLDQFYERMLQAGFDRKDIALVSGTSKPLLADLLERPYTLAMVQTYGHYPLHKLCDAYHIVIGDEIHHCIDQQSLYGKAMRTNLAPIKLGFTATLPPPGQKELILEGLVGPVIGELTINEAVRTGSMARPCISLINVPYNVEIAEYRKWRELYQYGIVANRVRNGLLLRAVKDRINNGNTCLIMVKELAHGSNLAKLAQLMGFEATFIHGQHKSSERNAVKEALINQHLTCVITTDIWREGVDIPTLNVVVNACGGKSEIQTLQAIGRGTRRVEGKDTVEIIDFLDPYRYLADHAVRRLQIYNQHGWI